MATTYRGAEEEEDERPLRLGFEGRETERRGVMVEEMGKEAVELGLGAEAEAVPGAGALGGSHEKVGVAICEGRGEGTGTL